MFDDCFLPSIGDGRSVPPWLGEDVEPNKPGQEVSTHSQKHNVKHRIAMLGVFGNG